MLTAALSRLVPLALGAFDAGELKGAHYYVATAGYVRRVGRLPDFVGGPVFAGAWLETGTHSTAGAGRRGDRMAARDL
jgi:hypothetical protein